MFPSLFGGRKGASQSRPPRSRRPARCRLAVEPLEDRVLLSVFTVDRLTDLGEGNDLTGDLRYCINQANALVGDDTITFSVTGTINLTGALPDLSSNIDIQGPGAATLTVRRDTGGDYRIFSVGSGATVSLSGLKLSNGLARGQFSTSPPWSYIPANGGGISNAGMLTVSNCTVSGNGAAFPDEAGGIFNSGTLTLNNSTVSGNAARWAGGISNSGTLTLNNSTVSSNSFGGIFNYGSGTLTVSSSTISENDGQGIFNRGTLTVTNSTISGNSAEDGGGIYVLSGMVTVTNSTISGNTAYGEVIVEGRGGGIYSSGATGVTLNLRNTILAGNTAFTGADLFGSLTTSGYNLIGDSRGGSGFAETDLLDVDPRLGPLQDNGGPTWTHALLPSSPALDAGDNTDGPEFDQRGLNRIVAGRIDIGAFEVQTPPVTIASVLLNDGHPQRSSIYSLTVTFSSTVTVEDNAFELVNQDGVPVSLVPETSVVEGRTMAFLTFTGYCPNGYSLADGNYTLTVRGDRIRDSLLRRLDGDGDGMTGGNGLDSFFRLYGDSDGDRDVDAADLEAFVPALGTTSENEGFLWWFDFDGDGDVDGEDEAQFRARLVTA